MRNVALFGLALVMMGFPLAAAAGSGELVSGSPVAISGAGRVDATGVTLFHVAAQNATLSGSIYNGTIVERHRHIQYECGINYEEEHVRFSSGGTDLRFLTFEARRGAVATATLNSPTIDLGKSSTPTAPLAYVGPNPYRYASAQEPRPDYFSPQHARAFPLQQFLVAPTHPVLATGSGRAVIEMGSILVHQAGQSSTLSSETISEQRACPSGTLPGVSGAGHHTIVKTIWLHFTAGVLEAQPRPLDMTLAYWRGDRGIDETRPGSSAAPRGYWSRADPDGLLKAYEAIALPHTSLASDVGLAVHVDGRAAFTGATGTLSDGNSRTWATPTDVDLSGALVLSPVHEENAGRTMTTRLDGDLYDLDVATSPSMDWGAFAMGAVGGGLVLGVALYGWPGVRWKITQLLFFPLYARLRKEEILENPLRDDILHAVQEQPGISASELGRRLDCGWGTLVYHLTVLERMQLVSSAREGRHKRFFAQGRINYSDKGAVGLLANPAARNILDAIRRTPGVIQKELGDRLGLAAGTIAWHVERLEAEGLVVREEDGRSVRYYPSERLLRLTERLAA